MKKLKGVYHLNFVLDDFVLFEKLFFKVLDFGVEFDNLVVA